MNLTESIILEIYESLPYGRVAPIIEKYSDDRITDTLIEKYIDLASQRKFTFDPIIFEIRKLNKFDNNIIEGKLNFTLDDESIIVISENTYFFIKNSLEENIEGFNFMKASKDNFMKVFEIISKHKGK